METVNSFDTLHPSQLPEDARELEKELRQITKDKNEASHNQEFKKVLDIWAGSVWWTCKYIIWQRCSLWFLVMSSIKIWGKTNLASLDTLKEVINPTWLELGTFATQWIRVGVYFLTQLTVHWPSNLTQIDGLGFGLTFSTWLLSGSSFWSGPYGRVHTGEAQCQSVHCNPTFVCLAFIGNTSQIVIHFIWISTLSLWGTIVGAFRNCIMSQI